MASPPAGSPPSSNLALPRQRPPLGLVLPSKSRKPSLASTPSAHPLRQTSFPPPDSLEAQSVFSPGEDGSLDDFSDTEIRSAISGPAADENFATATKKRKRGEKRPRGRPAKEKGALGGLRTGSVSLVNGEDGRGSRRGGSKGAPSVVTGDGAEAAEEEDEEDEDEDAATGGDKEGFNQLDLEQDNRHRYLFREAVGSAHQNRYDSFNKVKLRTADVRRLVNATLSQSVPQNVVTVVGAYTKMFAGMLIESAREVQSEWMAVSEKRPDGEENRAYKRLKMMQPEHLDEEEEEDEDDEDDEEEDVEKPDSEKSPKVNGESSNKTPNGEAKTPDKDRSKSDGMPDGDYDPDEDNNVPGDTQPNSSPNEKPNSTPNGKPNGKPEKSQTNGESKKEDDDLEGAEHLQPSAWGLSKYLDECDRGPLLPDHLREALRRYKKSRNGGTVGFTGISLERPEVSAPRMGGKRLFK
ncbi:hypothetical protein M409DRAFT_51160 [Zasmidium cellare ATCC 36951]|uniref:TAFII28-like protein domain-containing protein n=1 Tax=Zasmidium cellare ATCC 36951 TaxID=1080233 RepID=A0A6A6CXH9_ZASCE|nr:uncharacterized protein M409DRAFT_51160 [Zasmidium cellare ATCC 36951]KAF2170920.1 hypothetical protein M409DRAFT_51160 [Zasmidium cellare ATCC 36951]